MEVIFVQPLVMGTKADAAVLYKCTKRMALIKITFSNSRNDAGDTSECLRSSGLRGGAKPLLPLDNCWLEPSLTSECRR